MKKFKNIMAIISMDFNPFASIQKLEGSASITGKELFHEDNNGNFLLFKMIDTKGRIIYQVSTLTDTKFFIAKNSMTKQKLVNKVQALLENAQVI